MLVQFPHFSESQNCDDSLTKWVTRQDTHSRCDSLTLTVNVLHSFSGTIASQGVGLVNTKKSHGTCSQSVPFSPISYVVWHYPPPTHVLLRQRCRRHRVLPPFLPATVQGTTDLKPAHTILRLAQACQGVQLQIQYDVEEHTRRDHRYAAEHWTTHAQKQRNLGRYRHADTLTERDEISLRRRQSTL
jgi:hypothetical protein